MHKILKILLVASGFFLFAGGLFGPLYAVFVKDIGGDLVTAGSAYSIFALVTGVVIYLISKWEDRIKNQGNLVMIGFFFSSIGFLGYTFVKTPLHLFFVQMILGLGEAVRIPAYDGLYSKFLEKGKFASQWGVWESMYWIVTGLAALIGGYVAWIFGFQVIFALMFIFSLFGLFTSWALVRELN